METFWHAVALTSLVGSFASTYIFIELAVRGGKYRHWWMAGPCIVALPYVLAEHMLGKISPLESVICTSVFAAVALAIVYLVKEFNEFIKACNEIDPKRGLQLPPKVGNGIVGVGQHVPY